MQDAPSFPNDLAACQALLANQEALLQEQAAALAALQAAREKLAQENVELNLTLQKLWQRLYGSRSERHADPSQLQLNFGDDPAVQEGLAEAAAEAERITQTITYEREVKAKSKTPRSEAFPTHLPRQEVTVAPAPEELRCGEHGEKILIGHDRVETLVFERPKLHVLVTLYPKYACAGHAECGVVQPPRPTNTLVEGNRYDTSIGTEIAVAKYDFHLPIYRQQDYFAGSGWLPSRSTLLNIQASVAYVLEPLYFYLADQVRTSPVIPCDETSVMLLLPPEIPQPQPDNPRSQRICEVLTEARQQGKKHVLARMWAYRSLGPQGLDLFDFTVSRHRDGPQEFLKDYAGILLGDCYSGFESIALASDSRITRAACHAHARRYIHDARDYAPRECAYLLAIYRQLFDVEEQVRGKSATEIVARRQQVSAPLMAQLRAWLDGPAAANATPKSLLGKATTYLRNQWEPLSVFLRDGRVPLDNNETEQLMKKVATGRKNWLFQGSVEAGRRAAILLTVISTAHRHHLDVWAYVKDVLDRLLAGETDYASLRADVWAAAHPDALRPHRITEARYKADAQQHRRARQRLLARQLAAKPQ
jgi:transposase